jgi:hypothetical protein
LDSAGKVHQPNIFANPKRRRLAIRYDGHQMDAQQSYVHYTTSLSLKSVGVVSVDSGQVSEVDLTWRPDPTPFPEHAVIDFSSLVSPSRMKAKASALAEKARIRGWTHQP